MIPPADNTGAFPRAHVRAPLYIALAWWLACLVMFLAAWPIPFYRTNAFRVTLLVLACAALLTTGFLIATRESHTPAPLRKRYPRSIVLGVLASAALVGPAINAYSGYGLGDFEAALADQGAAFEQSTQRILEGTESRSGLLLAQSVLAPLTLVALPFSALYWFERRRGLPIFLVALGIPIVTSIMVGRDQQLGWSVIVVGSAWLLSRFRRGLGVSWKSITFLLVAAVGFAVTFALRKASRGGTGAVCQPGAMQCSGLREERTIIESAVQSMASYMSQGMEGLGRALNTDWVFGGGLAHSPAVNDLLSRVFGFQQAPSVSTQLTDVGWSATWYWSTSITSFANDIPWALIPLLFFLQGLLLGASWKRALHDADFLSVGVFVLTWLGVLFTPQNLQLAVSGPTYIGYAALVLSYLVRGFSQANFSGSSRMRV